MALDDITNYLHANRGKYPREVLLAQLRKAGYPESEIQVALKETTPSSITAAKSDTAFSIAGFLAGLAVNLVLFAAGAIGVLFLLVSLAFGGGSVLASPPAQAAVGLIIIFVVLPFFLYFRLRKKYTSFAKGAKVVLILEGVALILSLFAYIYYFSSATYF